MTDTTTQAVERLAQRHTLNDDEAATLRVLAADRDALATAHVQLQRSLDAANARADATEAQLADATRAKECFQRMTRAHWEALCAMRNNINEYVPMPNTDSGPLFSPESGPIYADIAERVVTAILALRDKPAPAVTVERVQHIKRGTTYQIVARGKLQTDAPLNDYAELVAYRCEETGDVWFRPQSEFTPDRFRTIAGGGDE